MREIDILGIDEENKTIYFGECKWSRKKVGENVFAELVSKSKLVDWNARKRKERFIIFSKSGFTESMLKLAQERGIILVEGERVMVPS